MTDRCEWFRQAKWGVLTHYLAPDGLSSEDWNRQVDNFDVGGLAQQLEYVRAPYYFMTLGQNSGHYCSPNATYDSLVGISPSKCSNRDIVKDLYEALNPRGIRVMVYLPSGAPDRDPVAVKALEWEPGAYHEFSATHPNYPNYHAYMPEPKEKNKELVNFQCKWEKVIAEWSKRWGRNVHGWWFDGCYFAKAMYQRPEPPNFASFAEATRAGNPNAIVAFNVAVLTPIITVSEHEDYTAGEIAHALPVDIQPKVKHAQYHILTFLGAKWCDVPLRFTDEFAVAYTKHVTDRGGVITWDVPITPQGLIPEAFVQQLAKIGRSVQAG